MLMPFGHYKGWELKDLPLSYLLWLSEDADGIYGSLKWEVEKVLQEVFSERDMLGEWKISSEDRGRLVVYKENDVKQWWEYYSRVFSEVFYGYRLAPPNEFRIEKSRRWMGYWGVETRIIGLNNYYILPQENFENILVHEMCHQYITDMHITDTSAHGRRWRNIAAKMSLVVDNPITIYDDDIYAPNTYRRDGQLVILPEKKIGQKQKRKLTEEEIERTYAQFIEELGNM